MPTRKRKTGAEPASNGPACGDCLWWVPDESEPSHGYCHMAPPVPVMDGDGAQRVGFTVAVHDRHRGRHVAITV